MFALSWLIAIAATAPIDPQKAPQATSAAAAPTAAAAYREALEVLCSEAMAGRAAGTPGSDAAIGWLVAEFARLGLEPHGPDHRQVFPVDDPLPPAPGPGMACTVAGGVERCVLQVGRDWCAFPFSPDGALRGPLVFAGHGIASAELGIDDYADIDVRGKVAVVLRGGPRWRSPGDGTHGQAAFTFTRKAATAHARGAIALLLVDRGDAARRLTAQSIGQASGKSAIPLLFVDRSAAARWLPEGWLDRAQQVLDDGGTPPALPAGLCIEGAVALLRRTARSTANVVGGVPPSGGGELAPPWIVVAAHHDHIGRGEFGSLGSAEEVGRLHPGADDNASGVAALRELARRCARSPLRRSRFVALATGAEELGQAGSRWFLEHLPAGARIAAVIDLNMIGRARSAGVTVFGATSAAGLTDIVERGVARAGGLRVAFRARSSYRSDQAAFLGARIPALLVTSGMHDQYHRPADVPELVEVEAALAIVDAIEGVVRDLDAGADPVFCEPPAGAGGR